MAQNVTIEQVKERVGTLVHEHPDRLNPMGYDEVTCVYTDPQDPSRHCIVGQVLVDLGIELPPENVMPGDEGFPIRDEEIQEFLVDVQNHADELTHRDRGWGHIPPDVFA